MAEGEGWEFVGIGAEACVGGKGKGSTHPVGERAFCANWCWKKSTGIGRVRSALLKRGSCRFGDLLCSCKVSERTKNVAVATGVAGIAWVSTGNMLDIALMVAIILRILRGIIRLGVTECL